MKVRRTPNLVSVILPARNAASTIGDQLDALDRQTYSNPWEIVVVDNASTDATRRVVEGFQGRVPLRIVEACDDSGVSYARNCGVKACEGSLLAFCDADDVVAPEWLSALVSAALSADIVGGRLDGRAINDPLAFAWRGEIPQAQLMTSLDFMPFAPGCNCAIWRDVVDRLEGWRTSYRSGSDDVDFCWRAQLLGYRIAYEPGAVVQYRFRPTLSQLARQFRLYGRSEALLYKDHRSHGARRMGAHGYAREWNRLARLAARGLGDLEERGQWVRQAAYLIGRLEGAVIHRVLFL